MTIAQLPIHIMLITPIAVALFVLGILVATGKADRWIAGYNTASEEERAKVNIKRVRWISAIILWISDIYLVFLAIANLSAIGIIITTLAFIVVCIIFTILTATSGDTGKAALEGFRDVPGIDIAVFYPRDGVSPVQKAQMVTQEGGNVHVCAVDGNFDDAQSGVKQIFESVRDRGLSSANSINIGRLVPQVVYYFSAYADLVKQGRLTPGAKLSFTVPTGNFGDILAGFIAGELGLPIGRLVCASNENNVLTDFLRTGTYDRRRSFYRTLSPSMDILISSNLERLLYLVSGDCELVASLMQQLKTDGFYTVPAELLEKIQSRFWAGCCGDEATEETIREVWERHSYLCDTHTAVAWNVARQYEKAADSPDPMVVLSTASPYKFPAAVLSAIGAKCDGDEFDMMSALEKVTGVPMPANLRSLRERPVLHTGCVKPGKMRGYVLDLLEGKT